MEKQKRKLSKLNDAELEKLTLSEAQALLRAVRKEIQQRDSERRGHALEQIREIAKAHDLWFDDIVAALRRSALRKKATPIYRNPDNPRQTWSGKGEAPDWYRNAKNKSALLIP